MLNLSELAAKLEFDHSKVSLRALQIGLTSLAVESAQSNESISTALNRIIIPSITDCCEFYFDDSFRLAGFVSWVRVDDEVDRLFIECGPKLVHSDKFFKTGKNLWIVNFIAAAGEFSNITSRLRDSAFRDEKIIKYVKSKPYGWMIKSIQRNSALTFFRSQAVEIQEIRANHPHVLERRRENFAECTYLGHCLEIIRNAGKYKHSSFAPLLRRLRHCQRIGNLKLYYSGLGKPIALVTWAWMSDRSYERLATKGPDSWHLSEWNEGEKLCFMDLFWTDADTSNFRMDVEQSLFPNELEIYQYKFSHSLSTGSVRRLSQGARKIDFQQVLQ